MKYIEEFYLFVKVVQEGGFSHAAAALGMPTGTISRRISQLEEQLGCSLLHRSTRKLRLTDEGLRYYERLCTPLAEIEQAAGQRMELLTAQMAAAQGVDEQMKSSNQMKWVGLMNNIRQAAEEAVLNELVYA